MSAETVFKAMADSTRRRIVQLLAHHELSVSDLVACLRQPQSTVSRHLKVLRDAALVRDRRDGTTVLYAAPDSDGRENGEAGVLVSRMLDWVGEEPMPSALSRRLDRVLSNRRKRSADFFDRVGDRWDQMRLDAFGGAFHLEAMVALLPREWVVADIGTGTGYLLPVLGATFRKVVAVDPVPRMLKVARGRCAGAGLKNVLFRQGDLGRLPIREKGIDLACAVLVLHHVPSPGEALVELARVLKPGGKLLIVEQKAHDIETFHERMQDRWWGFETKELTKMVASAGFDRVEARHLSSETVSAQAVEAPELFVLTAERTTRSAPKKK